MKRIYPKNAVAILTLLLAWGYLWSSCVDEYKLPTEISKKFEAEVVIQGRIPQGQHGPGRIPRADP